MSRPPPPKLHPVIPRVLCPRCATVMRLSEIVPEADGREVTRFDCDCGFIYTMSPDAHDEERSRRPPAA